MENANNKKGSFKGLLPLVIFLVVYFAMGIGTGDFGNFPLMIGIFLASAISLFMNAVMAMTISVVSGMIIGVIHGDFSFVQSFSVVHDGMMGMQDMAVIANNEL